MKTIIFDIDGTLTNMWPIEKAVLLGMTQGRYEDQIEELKKSGVSDTYKIFRKVVRKKVNKIKYFYLYNSIFAALLKNKKLPKLEKYPIVDFILSVKHIYNFVYASGGQKIEIEYVLKSMGIIQYFHLNGSINKGNCRFSKKTGIPFRIIKSQYPDCILITDSQTDSDGAELVRIPTLVIKPGQASLKVKEWFRHTLMSDLS